MPAETPFPDLDAAFAPLRNSSPVFPPGPDAVRRTVEIRRQRRRGVVRGLASVVIFALLAGFGWGLSHRHSQPAVIWIEPAVPRQWWPSPLPTDPGQLREISVQAFTYAGHALSLPTSEAGCPAATLHFNTEFRASAHGVRYTLEALTAAYGDLTGDGHSELAVVVSCRIRGQTHAEIVVVTAIDGTAFRTLALGRLPDGRSVVSMAIGHELIVTYSGPTIRSPATEIHRYLLIGAGRIAVEGPTATPTA